MYQITCTIVCSNVISKFPIVGEIKFQKALRIASRKKIKHKRKEVHISLPCQEKESIHGQCL